MTEKIKIYTDGACLNNPGPGGWGAALVYGDEIKELSGSVHDTTNQQMELLAVIKGLAALKRDSLKVGVYSDSAYLINAYQKGWLKKWKANNWRKSKDPLQNKFLWQWLDSLVEQYQVDFHKVKAHSGIELNELVDDLAREAAKKIADRINNQTTISTDNITQESKNNNDDYKIMLEDKALEFIIQLQKKGFQAEIEQVFRYQITLSLFKEEVDYGNLRIYYKPSKDYYTLNFIELKDKSIEKELKRIWAYESNHKS